MVYMARLIKNQRLAIAGLYGLYELSWEYQLVHPYWIERKFMHMELLFKVLAFGMGLISREKKGPVSTKTTTATRRDYIVCWLHYIPKLFFMYFLYTDTRVFVWEILGNYKAI